MNKELEFIRKAVLKACHPECGSYEKALEKELGFMCVIKIGSIRSQIKCIIFDYFYQEDKKDKEGNRYIEMSLLPNCDEYQKFSLPRMSFKETSPKFLNVVEIIGQPITLDRILRAIIQGERSLATSAADLKILFHIIYDWDYDQSTLQEQTEEIQISISKLLGYEKE